MLVSILRLAPKECERARTSRDRRYDGHFFTGVKTTDLLPAGLPGSARARLQRALLPFCRRGRTRGVSTLP
jgi:Metal binding domain of Ada